MSARMTLTLTSLSSQSTTERRLKWRWRFCSKYAMSFARRKQSFWSQTKLILSGRGWFPQTVCGPQNREMVPSESCKGLEKTDLLPKNANFWLQDFPSLHANVIITATAIVVKVQLCSVCNAFFGWLKIYAELMFLENNPSCF